MMAREESERDNAIDLSFDSTFFPIFDLRNESNVDWFDFAKNRICLLCYFSDKFVQKKE